MIARQFFLRLAALLFLAVRAVSCEEYALVLSGGGGKGAYEVGVWKALSEFGIAQKTTLISGTSVGGLNAALFACVTPSEAESIWLKEVPGRLQGDGSLISQAGLDSIIGEIGVEKIKTLSYPKVFVTAVRNDSLPKKLLKLVTSEIGSYSYRFLLNEEADSDEIRKKLLATSAFPLVMKPVKLSDGNYYSDGGQQHIGGDNTPVAPVEENAGRVGKAFVVYLKDVGSSSRHSALRRPSEGSPVDFIDIVPSVALGNFWEGTANFSEEKIASLIELGYSDTVALLRANDLNPVSSFWFR